MRRGQVDLGSRENGDTALLCHHWPQLRRWGQRKNQSLSTCERPHMLRLAPGSGKAACEFWCRTNGPHLRPCQHPQTVGGDANHSCLTPPHPHSCHFGSFQVKKETFPSPSSVQLTWPLHLAHIFRRTEKYLLFFFFFNFFFFNIF